MASNRRLNATITIGGAITGALRTALGDTQHGLQRIGSSIRDLERGQRQLGNSIQTFGRMGRNVDGLRERYARAGDEIDRLRRRQERLRREVELGNAISDVRNRARTQMLERGAAAIGTGMLLAKPLTDFKDLDEALNNMQVAMMDRTGGLPKEFETIKRQTIELGNLLPGTTADFVNLATALKEQGVPMEVVARGALKSAAHLAVVMKMAPEQAGEMVAKLREAFQLQDREFGNMADFTQRARFGFGLKPEDLLLGAKYYGGKLNALGLTGAENVRKIYAIQGMAAQQGMDGSTFGTNFSMMLTRVGLMTERLNKNSKEMRAVNAELARAGVHLSFFDKQGKFAGVDNMVQQLGKLSVMTQEKRLQVLTRIFGEEGGRVADLIARNGTGGYNDALGKMDSEAGLDQRISVALKSYKNQLEALQGTFTNFLAAVGEPIAKMFTPVMKQLNEIIGGPLQKFVEQNQTAVAVIGGLVAGTAGILALGAAVSAVGWAGALALGGLTQVVSGIRMVGAAFAFVGRLMLLNPIGLTITAIAVGALLIYKYWEPIKAFFADLWDGIKNTFNKSVDYIMGKINWIGDKWREFKKLLGFGDDKQTQHGASGDWNSPAPPPVPPLAAGRGASGTTVNDHSQVTFQIMQQPGQSHDDLANIIMRKMKQQQGVKSRSMMFDPVMP